MLTSLRTWIRTRKQQYIIDSFHELYYTGRHTIPLYQTTTWLGIPAFKCPLDLWIYQEIIVRTRPDVIIETGVHEGGSTLFMASVCDFLQHGRVVGVDVTLEHVGPKVRSHPRITLFESSSTDAALIERLRAETNGQRVMVNLDSDHSRDHVLAELRNYQGLVSPDCYLICEDSNVNGHPVFQSYGPGPHEAIAEFLSEHPEWHSDLHCERLLMTFNPTGYLIRR
jgi:cephalosporin hydroxylase